MTIEKDKMVRIHYTLKDDDGNELDTSVGSEPLEYLHGTGFLLPKLEEELEGKGVGDKFSAVIEAKDGYGEYQKDLVAEVDRKNFDSSVPIEVGMKFQAEDASGLHIVTVTALSDDKVTIDANHELAGKRLHFDIEVLDVRDATEVEILHAQESCSCGGCGGCGGDCNGEGEGCCGGCGR